MKPLFVALLLAATITAHAQRVPAVPASAGTMPQDKTQPSPRLNPKVTDRAEHLSAQIVRDLHLNGYQSSQLRAINTEKMTKLDALEHQYANDPTALADKSKVIAQERDKELQGLLTTDQYTDYLDARKRYTQADQEYARSTTASILINSVQNPTPARANDAVIGPAKAKATTPRTNEPFGRTLRQ
ncbi:MAG: hypothetical protein ACRYFX_31385 [Janthinobacterium lividum]